MVIDAEQDEISINRLAKILKIAIEREFDFNLFKEVYKLPPMNNVQVSDLMIQMELYKILFYDRSFWKCLFGADNLKHTTTSDGVKSLEVWNIQAIATMQKEFECYKRGIDYLHGVLTGQEENE